MTPQPGSQWGNSLGLNMESKKTLKTNSEPLKETFILGISGAPFSGYIKLAEKISQRIGSSKVLIVDMKN
jgi:hypothetical protein